MDPWRGSATSALGGATAYFVEYLAYGDRRTDPDLCARGLRLNIELGDCDDSLYMRNSEGSMKRQIDGWPR